MKFSIILPVLLVVVQLTAIAQHKKTDANIIGHVTSKNEHLPFVNIMLKGTNIGTTTDETGHYQMINLPEGNYILRAWIMGYAPQEQKVEIIRNKTLEINFSLQEDMLGLEEVVITGDRNDKNRRESVVSVNTITPKLFEISQSVTISDGLNFCPGIRTENNCQNCGFNQVRMNGMEGAYSQILIDGRPVFSGLASVYGLELIPASMISRIEVVKGGGSVLYGSSAIAGTINLILGEPTRNSYEFGITGGLVGLGVDGAAPAGPEFTIHSNGSILSTDHQSGMSLFGFYRNRQPFDANNDGFSEISKLWNLTTGTRLFHRFGTRSKLTADLFFIHEDRRGGNNFDRPPHESDIAEWVAHDLINGALSSQTYFREQDALSVYFSGQYINRDSYYGANCSLKDYGNTVDFTWVAGTQYAAYFKHSNLVTGIEFQASNLTDHKLGYPDLENAMIINDTIKSIPHTENTLVADQSIQTAGLFAQYEYSWKIVTLSAGLRYDRYYIRDNAGEGTLDAHGVWIPRVNAKVMANKNLDLRISYAKGYRAPQIFDEDLHIETSGSRQVIHRNAPGLTQENSHSAMICLDYHITGAKSAFDFQAEGFLTLLQDPFTMEYGLPDSNGVVIYTRYNSPHGAKVYGVNLQVNMAPVKSLAISSGFTWQQSLYDTAQAFGENRFFRTPSTYGFLTLDWEPFKRATVSSTLNYTGPMLVPYFGPDQADPDAGELRTSQTFFDWGFKLSYTIPLNGASVQLSAGIKNLLNAYQHDFDRGIDRDPGYMYGPIFPRSVYFGVSFGNML